MADGAPTWELKAEGWRLLKPKGPESDCIRVRSPSGRRGRIRWERVSTQDGFSFHTCRENGDLTPNECTIAELLVAALLYSFVPHGVRDGETCGQWRPAQTFQCPICERIVCYCMGCDSDDGGGELCDECWCKHWQPGT